MAGVKDTDFRTQNQTEIANRKAALDAKKEAERDARDKEVEARREAKAKRVYQESVGQYEREQQRNTDPVNKFLVKKADDVGDFVRSIGKKLGTNRMTSQDDEAKMQARKDVKGYKKGGMVKSSASKRADGIAIKGKTKGRFV
jgi:hypothetical protein